MPLKNWRSNKGITMKFLNLIYSFVAFFFYKLIKDDQGAFTYGQVTAITHDAINDMLADGVFTSNAFMKRCYDKRKKHEGGNKIIEPIMAVDDTGSTGGFYQRADALSLQEYDGITASEHDWKYLYESVVIYKPDIAKNAGRLGVLKLVASKMKQMKKNFNQRMVKGILSDGTVATGALSANQFVGLQAIIADGAGAYGGILPADLAQWVSFVDDNGGVNRAWTQAIWDKVYDQAVEEGIVGPTLGISGKAVFSKMKGTLTGFQRTTREGSVSGLGHKGQSLIYNGVDHLIENQMPANTFFYIDEECTGLHVQQDNDMRSQTIKDLETADALLERVFLYASYHSKERRGNSRVNDITE